MHSLCLQINWTHSLNLDDKSMSFMSRMLMATPKAICGPTPAVGMQVEKDIAKYEELCISFCQL